MVLYGTSGKLCDKTGYGNTQFWRRSSNRWCETAASKIHFGALRNTTVPVQRSTSAMDPIILKSFRATGARHNRLSNALASLLCRNRLLGTLAAMSIGLAQAQV